jgi:hypothetical protein
MRLLLSLKEIASRQVVVEITREKRFVLLPAALSKASI